MEQPHQRLYVAPKARELLSRFPSPNLNHCTAATSRASIHSKPLHYMGHGEGSGALSNESSAAKAEEFPC